jgi:hypothetical protein
MLASAKIIYNGACTLTPEEIIDSLSIKNLPKIDSPQGSKRYCHGLIADTKEMVEYLSGRSSGCKFYPPGGFLQWHTNSNDPGFRVYFVFVKEVGSFFRYAHKGQEITLPDEPGWNIRAFPISRKALLWHCVYAARDRYSFGFNCQKLKPELEQYLLDVN